MGDTIAIQGLAVRFHFSIHRISSENVPMLVTFSGNAFNDVYLGLVLQHHYVALEREFFNYQIAPKGTIWKKTKTHIGTRILNKSIIDYTYNVNAMQYEAG